MKEDKIAIIKEEGGPVSVMLKSEILYDTTALIGKATRQFFSELSLEAHRQIQFLPYVEIRNGMTVRSKLIDTDYIIIAKYPEVLENQVAATVTRAIVCNNKMTVSSLQETADRFGNVSRSLVNKLEDVSVYVESLGSESQQKSHGLFHDFQYRISSPYFKLDTQDTITLNVGGVGREFKVLGYDVVSFDGLIIIDVSTETR